MTVTQNAATVSAEEKVLERAKKMLALGNCSGATEGERDTALRMVYKLLAKHNLTMIDVDGHNSAVQEERESQQASFVVYPWARSIAGQIASLFFCNYYFMRPDTGKQATHVFIGKESNATTAQYMAEFVVKSVLKEAARMYGSATAPEARCFAVGVVNKLVDRVKQLKAAGTEDHVPGTALMLINLYDSEKLANATWLTEQGVKLKSRVSTQKGITNAAAFHAGKDFGAKVSLAPQVGANTPNRKAIS